MKYNLYFGEGNDQVEYYKPSTPETELQDLINDPDKFKQLKKDHTDEIAKLTQEKADLTAERDELKDKHKKQFGINTNLIKFLKDEVGYDNLADFKTALNGEKLPDILTNADNTI